MSSDGFSVFTYVYKNNVLGLNAPELQEQRDAIAHFCLERGWHISGEFADTVRTGRSGRKLLRRACRKAPADCRNVVVTDVARLGRDLEPHEQFARDGIRVYTTSIGPQGLDVLRMNALLLEQLSREAKATKQRSKRE